MILKILLRCFLCCVLFGLFVVGAVACCGVMAISRPGFYRAALAEPADEASVQRAMEEMELRIDSLALFVAADTADLRQLEALPEEALAAVKSGNDEDPGRLPTALEELQRSVGADESTYSVSLQQKHLNALLQKECGSLGRDVRDPRVSLGGDVIRLAVTVTTPATEVVLSCDLKPVQAAAAGLSFELHSVRIGRLPLPDKTLLRQYLQFNPKMPREFELDVTGEHPTLTLKTMPRDADLLVDDIRVANGELHVTFRRSHEAVVAAW
ncbi:MAG: hypothetical protein AAF589_06225 [Planctomycetota bacterium]